MSQTSKQRGLPALNPAQATTATGIPADLRAIAQWVAWKRTHSKAPGGKFGKVPVDPHTGRSASTTDPSTWGTFDESCRRAEADDLAGIGFVFASGGDIVGVDLDGCRDPATGVIDDWAQAHVGRLASYAEVSPSGTGVHIIVRGKLPTGGRRKGAFEVYDRDRFFTVTGQLVPGAPAIVEERTDTLAAIHCEVFGKPPTTAEPRMSTPAVPCLSDEELLAKASEAANGAKFRDLWSGDITGYESRSEADAALCCLLAFWTGKDAARMDTLFRRSGLMRAKWDELHGAATYGASTTSRAIDITSDVYTGATANSAASSTTSRDDENLATRVVGLVQQSGAVLFHDENQEPYASVPRDGHVETYRLRDRVVARWVSALAYHEFGKAIGATVLADALRTLESLACFEGAERAVHIRVAAIDAGYVLDLGSASCNVVVIGADGWRVEAESPVIFRRPRGMQELPEPVREGRIAELRPFVNCTEDDWPLLLAWLVAALRPRGPYPVLALIGEKGSAKSTTARVQRALTDPNMAALRNPPRTDRDLMVSASNGWVLAFDNISSIPAWFSDALCCISTGSGFAARQLYTDDNETILAASRPTIMTGIEDFVSRSDLLDRSLLCAAPTIGEEARRDEETFWRDFDAARPRILGALLDAVACGLRRLPDLRLDRLPRMADFARWATACEPGLGLADGAVLAALRRSGDEAVQVALEASVIASAVRALVEERGSVEMAPTELLELLTLRLGPAPPPKGWPKNAQTLSGQLRRLAPDLRAVGIEFERDRAERNSRRLIHLRKVGQDIVHTVHVVRMAPEEDLPARVPPPKVRTIPRTIEGCDCTGSSTAPRGPQEGIAGPADDVDDVDGPPRGATAAEEP